MASKKKRGKQLLQEINQLAAQLAILTAELSLLDDMHRLALDIGDNVEQLTQQLDGLKKAEFCEVLAGSEVLLSLDEIVDIDAISLLEERLLAVQPEDGEGELSLFLQQLMDKLEKHYVAMITAIQALCALPDDE